MICKTCGHIGQGKRSTPGNLGIEIVLWLCLIIPGLIYSVWRVSSRYNACQVCGGRDLIPTGSPIGQRLLGDTAPPKRPDATPDAPGILAAGLSKPL